MKKLFNFVLVYLAFSSFFVLKAESFPEKWFKNPLVFTTALGLGGTIYCGYKWYRAHQSAADLNKEKKEIQESNAKIIKKYEEDDKYLRSLAISRNGEVMQILDYSGAREKQLRIEIKKLEDEKRVLEAKVEKQKTKSIRIELNERETCVRDMVDIFYNYSRKMHGILASPHKISPQVVSDHKMIVDELNKTVYSAFIDTDKRITWHEYINNFAKEDPK